MLGGDFGDNTKKSQHFKNLYIVDIRKQTWCPLQTEQTVF